MNFKRKILWLILLVTSRSFVPAQSSTNIIDSNNVQSVQKNFDKAFNEITSMLNGKQRLSFKRAVFLVENAYYGDSLSYGFFCLQIELYKKLVQAFYKTNKIQSYKGADSFSENKNASLFKVFTDTIRGDGNRIVSLPFQYNFQDALGSKDYSSIFVSTLLETKKGNCRSLPYLYKILTEELGTKAYLALAPMHIYIKQRNKNVGWYNVELTSGQYPKDAYLISTGYISQDNIRSGLYMDTLSLKESVALCLMDLCQAYCNRMGAEADVNFQMNCANEALQIKSNLIDGLLKKQILHKNLWRKHENEGNVELSGANKKMYNETNTTLIKLDYKDVPKETFEKWYLTYQQNKSRYDNPEINKNFKPTVK